MLKIKELAKKDYNQAINFAMTGMNFDKYARTKFFAYQISRFYFLSELENSTYLKAIYDDDQFAGFLMVRMHGEPLIKISKENKTFLRFGEWISQFIRGEDLQNYRNINSKMLADARKTKKYDGEIVFFAVDTNRKGKGLGSMLLRDLEERYRGKTVYLFTDEGCSYGFYDKRGFKRAGTQTVTFGSGDDAFNLECYLYEKKLGS